MIEWPTLSIGTRHLIARLAAHGERDQELADAVAVEVDGDGQAGSWSVRGSTARSTMARMGPSMPRTPRVVGGLMCDFGGARAVGAAGSPGGAAVCAYGGARLVHVATDDALLPLVGVGRVGGVGEYVPACRSTSVPVVIGGIQLPSLNRAA